MAKHVYLIFFVSLFASHVSSIFFPTSKSEVEQTIFNLISTTADGKSAIGTTFSLYTTTRKTKPLNFTTNEINIKMPADAGFQISKRTIFVVHGFIYEMALPWLEKMKDALLDAEDCNIFIVDWTRGDGLVGFNYPKAVANAKVVGEELAQFIKELKTSLGVDPKNVYIIGHSLGAHIAGFAGAQTPNLGRITGLDPAGPAFRNLENSGRLDPSDASLVDVIHTDRSDFILGEDYGLWDVIKLSTSFGSPEDLVEKLLSDDHSMYYGTNEKMGDLDFYPNDGKSQPGCPVLPASTARKFIKEPQLASKEFTDLLCSHYRAILLMIASIKNQGCKMEGCDGGMCFEMGYHADRNKPDKTHRDISLTTVATEPFCK